MTPESDYTPMWDKINLGMGIFIVVFSIFEHNLSAVLGWASSCWAIYRILAMHR